MKNDRESQEYHELLHKCKKSLFGPDHLVYAGEEGEGGAEVAEGEE
jgi:hypothetical protein